MDTLSMLEQLGVLPAAQGCAPTKNRYDSFPFAERLAKETPNLIPRSVSRVDRRNFADCMGITYVHARLRRPDGRGPTRHLRFLVDSGVIYSVLPEETWRALRLRPERQVEFTLADGTPITRSVSECKFEIRGHAATSPVVLGEEHDGALLEAVTLKTLGLMLNPLTREILPMRMALSHSSR
jgi:predicted aspartyl protease